jgi:hypothetical protein
MKMKKHYCLKVGRDGLVLLADHFTIDILIVTVMNKFNGKVQKKTNYINQYKYSPIDKVEVNLDLKDVLL